MAWGQRFEYDFHKVNDTIYWQMVENGWLGVACEPNCVFLICNQFPILGLRFHDVRHGTSFADEATASYRRAWADKGMLQADGLHFRYFWRQRQDSFIGNGRASADTWLGAVLNAWNRSWCNRWPNDRQRTGSVTTRTGPSPSMRPPS